jgi:hypothetical protein
MNNGDDDIAVPARQSSIEIQDDEEYHYYDLINGVKIRIHSRCSEVQQQIGYDWFTLKIDTTYVTGVVPKAKTVFLNITFILFVFIILLAVIVVGAIPIWAIESNHEKKTTGDVVKWTYGSSIYFTIVTALTLGFGDYHPDTTGGKYYTMFLILLTIGAATALEGVIATSVISASEGVIARNVYRVVRGFWYCINWCRGVKGTTRSRDLRWNRENANWAVYFFTSNTFDIIVSLLLIVVYAFIGSAIFAHLEHWSYINAIYFTVVTMST